MDGIATRNFRNVRHPGEISEEDFAGPRAILDNRYKLAVDGERDSGAELFDMRAAEDEAANLIGSQPEVAEDLQRQLREWQQSVLESLTGADYGPA